MIFIFIATKNLKILFTSFFVDNNEMETHYTV